MTFTPYPESDSDRLPFEPIGEQSRRAMIHEGICDLHLEPGTVITYDMIGDWLGEEFPLAATSGQGRYLVPSYEPMGLVKRDLLKLKGVLLLSVANVGYRVASDAEKVAEAEDAYRRAFADLRHAGAVARTVRRDRVDAIDAERARALERDAGDDSRVLNAKARERAKAARRW